MLETLKSRVSKKVLNTKYRPGEILNKSSHYQTQGNICGGQRWFTRLGLASNFSHFSISVISRPKCLDLCKHFGSDIEMVDLLDRYAEIFSKEASSDKMTAFVRLSSSLMLL